MVSLKDDIRKEKERLLKEADLRGYGDAPVLINPPKELAETITEALDYLEFDKSKFIGNSQDSGSRIVDKYLKGTKEISSFDLLLTREKNNEKIYLWLLKSGMLAFAKKTENTYINVKFAEVKTLISPEEIRKLLVSWIAENEALLEEDDATSELMISFRKISIRFFIVMAVLIVVALALYQIF